MKTNRTKAKYGTKNSKVQRPESTNKEPMQRRDGSLKMFCFCESKLITVTKKDIWDGRIPRCPKCSPVNTTQQ